MDHSVNELGVLLRASRQRQGLTQRELAERAGISVGAVRDLEQGRSSHPRARSIGAIADVLQLSAAHRAELRQLSTRRSEPPEPSGPVYISVLGPLSVTRAPAAVSLGSGRHRVVLARLALTPGQSVSRGELAHLLWGDSAPPAASNVLQTHVSRLRRILEHRRSSRDPDIRVLLTPGGYRLQLDEGQLDLLAYRSRLMKWQRIASTDPHRGFDMLGTALDMWRGNHAAEDVQELHGDPLVTALSEEVVDATIQLAHTGRVLQRLPEVLPRLRRLAALNPWHESLHAWLITALAASGQQATALDTFEEVRRRLNEELGIDPGTELIDARQAVLEGAADARERARVTVAGARSRSLLPASPPDFTGRAEQLHLLARLLGASRRRLGGEPIVCVVAGMPGVGKTSLALRAAQASRSDFPDGQLYIDLHGADDQPVSLAQAAATLLNGLGVNGRGVPGDTDEACALLRRLLVERRVLLVLDNARNAAQVRPLLPDTGDSAVLVTSRNQCSELAGARLVNLPVLSVEESLDLLRLRLGADRVTADLSTARALVEACGRLPVAVRVIASRLAANPERPLGELLHELADVRSHLDQFSVGDDAVTASFDLSYRHIGARLAQVFRLASLVPGETFSADAAAALLATDVPHTERALEALVAENLLHAVDPGRYRYHDLLRWYALQRAAADETTDRSAAYGRLADWYLGRTAAALRLVYPEMIRLPTRHDGERICFEDVKAAMAWLDGEADNLAALIDAVADGEHRAYSWQLADQLRGYFFVGRDTTRWLVTARTGLRAAEAAGDATAQAAMHQTLGQAYWSLGKHELALTAYERGREIARDSGWLVGEAYLLHNLGLVYAELGRPDEARMLYRQALDVGDTREFEHVRAVTLNDLGVLCTEQGRLAEAVEYLEAAVRINQSAAHRPSEMVNCGNLGMALRQLEQFGAAHENLQMALHFYRETGSAHGEMAILDELSHLNRQRGEWVAAVGDATEALRLAHELGDAKAQAGVLNTLGFALIGARALTDAQLRFRSSLQLSRARGYRYDEAHAGIGIAETMIQLGEVEQAATTAGEALDIARRNAYGILVGDASLVLAKTALAKSDATLAAEHCRLARVSYEAGGIPGRLRETDELLVRIGQLLANRRPSDEPAR